MWSDSHWPGKVAHAVLVAAVATVAIPAAAFTVNITAANPRVIYLQIGVGSFTGGNYDSGGTPANNATVNVVSVTVPAAQVGTGSLFANNSSVNLITFSVPAASVGNGTAVAATAGSGDIGNGTVTARVFGNGGTAVSLSASNGGALSDGSGNTISWAQITTTASALAGVPTLLNPITLVNGASTPVSLTAVSGVVNQGAQWTYSYANTATPVGGTYGGVNTNNGRVTYTATLP